MNKALERQIKENMHISQKERLLDSRTRTDYIKKLREKKKLDELAKAYRNKRIFL